MANTVEMVLDRNHTVRSTLGHMITFKKGEPTLVPAHMMRLCAEIGAKRTDKKDAIAPPEEESQPPQPIDPGQRLVSVRAAIEALVERNNVKDFTAGGTPKTSSVSDETGYKVDRTEVAKAWKQRNEELASNDTG